MIICRSSLIALVCAASMAGSQSQPFPSPPGRLVDVGGHRLHILCAGQGSPTVVFEAGASSFAIDFTLVQREVARRTRVCAYDRAGMGWSDPSPAAGSGSDARDLRGLLAAAGERPPYVLVGASRGGLLIRDFVLTYPDDAAGLVFLDPASEDRFWVMLDGQAVLFASLTPEQLRLTLPREPVATQRRKPQTGAPFDRLPPDLYELRIRLDERLIASYPDTVMPEAIAATQERERAFLARLLATRSGKHPLGDRPTIVLSRGDERNAGREGVHQALAELSTNGRHSIVPRAGHEIHLFEPTAVATAVSEVLDAIQAKAQLPKR